MHVHYLHGFASSPHSGKARFYREQLARHGVPLESLDFNEPSFETLTVTRMLDQLDEAIERLDPGPVALVGSSLGGFVAWHAAARRRPGAGQAHPITRLILLAPALDFPRGGRSETLADEWRRVGRREVFHYGYGRPMQIGYDLYEDARRYDSSRVQQDVSVLIFHGLRDDVVPPSTAIEFAKGRPGVQLRLLDDDHQLQAHLEDMWNESAGFLGLGPS
jgi:uncharacterized protein